MFAIRIATAGDIAPWALLRAALWPDASPEELRVEAPGMLADDRQAVFVCDANDRLLGFLEARLRDHAEGCTSSPVGYLEGWYVIPEARGRGIGRALAFAAEAWARTQGCTEMASDAVLDNVLSHTMHERIGYEETERIVCFRKSLK
jgi:aminoglycoside 6'-N-acetyltransferase I